MKRLQRRSVQRYCLLPRCADCYPQFILWKSPWAELDKEEESLSQDPLSGLGCNSVHDDWYGGKVAFTAKLRQGDQDTKKKTSQYYVELNPPELSASTRFMRRWGSRRFLRVRIPDSIAHQSDNR